MNDETSIVPAQAGPLLMQIADRVLGRPLLMHPQKVEVVLHVLQGRLPIEGSGLAPLSPDASRFTGSFYGKDGKANWFRTEGSVAIVDVMGSLVNRGAWIGANSGMTSYEGLAKQFDAIKAEAEKGRIRGAILDMNSPGGEVAGFVTLAAKVRELAGVIPVVAVANDMICSACYAIASQCTEIVASPTSVIGSIGVVMTHLDRSGELEMKGIKPTILHKGAHKADGHPFGPLPETVRASISAELDKVYDQFVGLVAQGRGDRLTEKAARATEARTYLGQEAIDIGLADRMASFEAVLASLQSQPARRATSSKGSRSMSGDNENTITAEAHATAVASARAEGHKAGAAEATTRIGAILNHEAAKDKGKLAMSLALDTDMSAEAAAKVLSAAAPETAPQASIPSPGQRAAGMTEMGGDVPPQAAAERSASIWAAQIANANASIGVPARK